MGRISILLGAAALATLAVVGCGSDSNGAKPTPAPSQCVGVNAEFSAGAFTSTLACKSDTATICGNDLPTIAGKCGASCFAAAGTISSKFEPAAENALFSAFQSNAYAVRPMLQRKPHFSAIWTSRAFR